MEETCEARKGDLVCGLRRHHESSMAPTCHSFDYSVPLRRPLTALEHAEHLDNHAVMARRLAERPGVTEIERAYHNANAQTFQFAADAVRWL